MPINGAHWLAFPFRTVTILNEQFEDTDHLSESLALPPPTPTPPIQDGLVGSVDQLMEEEILEATRLAEQELDRLSAETTALDTPTILVVDDDLVVAKTISKQMMSRGYKAFFVSSAEEVWDFVDSVVPHVVITDVHMPGMNGLELLAKATSRYPDMVVLVTSGAPDVDMTIEALRAGAVDFLVKPINFDVLEASIQRGITRRASRLKQLRYQINLETMILERTRRLIEGSNALALRTRQIGLAYRDLLERLGRASQWRDDETGEHIQRIGLFSAEIARKLGLSKHEVELIAESSPMHDIGKIGVPDAILLKPGRLTPLEFECMKAHTLIGAEILSGSEVPIIKASENIALSHHEWWNGGGYPYGLQGQKIPLHGRIVAVADVYDALIHARSYKKALPFDEAISTMQARAGTQFDPEVFDAFLEIAPELVELEEKKITKAKVMGKYNVEIGLFRMKQMYQSTVGR